MRVLETTRFIHWIGGLRDRRAKENIANYFDMLRERKALTGDVRQVGGHVTEVRFHFGPGYRVYLTKQGEDVVILLAGGDKATQERDIREAKRMASDWRNDARSA